MPFAELVGHEAAVRLLQGQIKQDRLSGTYLFVGPEGIGKRALAVAFAEELGCGTHDLLVVEPLKDAVHISIEQVREMENWMNLTPYGGKLKVAVLDSADDLTEESMHACLKILEEPPARSIFVLLASAPHRLPATLLSRCHRVRCCPQGIEKTAAALKTKGLDEAGAMMLSICAGGRFGLALQFQDSGRLEERNEALDLILAAARKRDLESPFPKKATREDVLDYLEWYASWWRDLLVLRLNGDAAWVVHQDRLPQLKQAAASVSPEAALSQVDRIYKVQEAIQRNASIKNGLALLLSYA